jgi:hypothetical protein
VALATDAIDESGDLATGTLNEPGDLTARLDDVGFEAAPHVPRTRPTVYDCAHRALTSAP